MHIIILQSSQKQMLCHVAANNYRKLFTGRSRRGKNTDTCVPLHCHLAYISLTIKMPDRKRTQQNCINSAFVENVYKFLDKFGL